MPSPAQAHGNDPGRNEALRPISPTQSIRHDKPHYLFVPPSQLPNLLQPPLRINKHTPPLPAPRATAKARHNRLEPTARALAALTLARIRNDRVVKGAGLQPHRRDAEGLGLLEDFEGYGGGRAARGSLVLALKGEGGRWGAYMMLTEVCFGLGSAESEGTVGTCLLSSEGTVMLGAVGLMGMAGMSWWRYQAKTAAWVSGSASW